MAKKRRVSWKWGGKTYYGTFLRETAKYIYATTHNGKTKKIPKK